MLSSVVIFMKIIHNAPLTRSEIYNIFGRIFLPFRLYAYFNSMKT
jgi:hypothetical protein